MKLVKEHINEKFTEKSDPIKDMGIGFNIYNQYLNVLQKNPKLKIYYNGKEIHHFKEIAENPKKLFINWNKEHPMSGYGGRTSWMRCWGSIIFIKGGYRVKCFLVEDSGPSEKYFKSFKTLEEVLKYIIPDFQGILSYYSEYSFGK